MEPFLEILRKYRPSHFSNGALGWGGCRCPCHGPHPAVMHFRACCHPTHEDFEAILELYREKSAAREEIQSILDEVRGGMMSSFMGMFTLAEILGGSGRCKRGAS